MTKTETRTKTRTDDRDVDDPEADLSALLDAHAAPRFWLHRHPVAAWRLLRLQRRLPRLDYRASATPDGRLMRFHLRRATLGRTTVLHRISSVLDLQDGPGPNGTSRTKRRRALRAEVTWRPVEDAAERSALIARAEATEQAHPDETYRSDAPDLAHLGDLSLWLLAEDADGEPLLLSVTAVDGAFAMLGYFRRLRFDTLSSNTRFLMNQVLVEQLTARGVRYLCDSESPLRLTSGLRRFSRYVGFRLHRVHCP